MNDSTHSRSVETNSLSLDLLTVQQAAKILNMSKSFLYQLAANRTIACYKIGQGAIRFRLDDLMAYLEECRVEPEKQTSRGIRPTGTTFQHLNPSRLAEAWRKKQGG
ncbi:MAG: helix-turn-helix domain-containing protein [Pirellulales bacterium]|jgi:excisionase family DNA binding protein|nr:helix-turn-helix domain-containing protein [Pirellulales bacterium]